MRTVNSARPASGVANNLHYIENIVKEFPDDQYAQYDEEKEDLNFQMGIQSIGQK